MIVARTIIADATMIAVTTIVTVMIVERGEVTIEKWGATVERIAIVATMVRGHHHPAARSIHHHHRVR